MSRPMSTLTRHSGTEGLRVGVKFSEIPEKNLLIIFKTQALVADFVKEIVQEYQLTDPPEQYVLSIEMDSGESVYVTEQNREVVKEASVLSLVRSPVYYVNDIMTKLNNRRSTVEWNIALKDLHTKHLLCVEFVQKFIESKGHEKLLELLESGQCSGQMSIICYQAGLHYNILMAVRVLFLRYGLPGSDPDNGMVSWELISEQAIQKLIAGMRYGEVTLQTLECSYDLLDHCLTRLPDKGHLIISGIEPDLVFARINNEVDGRRLPDQTLQVCLVSFLNSIFRQAKKEGEEMKVVCNLLTAANRDILKKCIPALRGEEAKPPLLRCLVQLQLHLLCPAAIRYQTALDAADPRAGLSDGPGPAESASAPAPGPVRNAMSSLNLMRSLVNPNDLQNRLSNWQFGAEEIEHFRQLGFENPEQPFRDFDIAHGGMLAYDCVTFFLQNHSQEAEELVSPKSLKEGGQFPFIQTSTILTNLLARKFRLLAGEPDRQLESVQETDFFPLLFAPDKPFQRVFSKCITAFARTWRDMRATVRDMDTVRKVMAEQLTQTFAARDCRERLQALGDGLQRHNYAEILRRQRQLEEEKRKNRALSDEIRRCLRPRINQWITENRIQHMQRGSKFQLVDSNFFHMKSKVAGGITWMLSLRLSPNKKDLYYEKIDTASQKPERRNEAKWTDEVDDKEKISLSNVTTIHFGTKCQHAIASKKMQPDNAQRCLTFIVKVGDEREEAARTGEINLIAPNSECLNIWLDGLNALRDREERSSLHQRDFERLVDLEIKVRSLHLPTGHDVSQPPAVPPEPPVLPKPLARV